MIPGSTDLVPGECWAPKTLHLELVVFLAKLGFGQRNAPELSTNKIHVVPIEQAGHKEKSFQTLLRQDKMVFQKFPASENGLSVTPSISQSCLLQGCKWDFDCPVR